MAKSSNQTASALIKTGGGTVFGIVVNSHTNGTLKLWDALTATGSVLFNTITFASGPGFYQVPGGYGDNAGVQFYTGLYATIGGTADFTIIYS